MNNLILTGNLCKDNELRYMTTGKALLKNSIAVKHQKDKTYFFDFDVWDKSAETFNTYTKKGSKVLLNGFLKQESWEDKTDGHKKTKVSITVLNFEFLDSKPKTENKPIEPNNPFADAGLTGKVEDDDSSIPF